MLSMATNPQQLWQVRRCWRGGLSPSEIDALSVDDFYLLAERSQRATNEYDRRLNAQGFPDPARFTLPCSFRQAACYRATYTRHYLPTTLLLSFRRVMTSLTHNSPLRLTQRQHAAPRSALSKTKSPGLRNSSHPPLRRYENDKQRAGLLEKYKRSSSSSGKP